MALIQISSEHELEILLTLTEVTWLMLRPIQIRIQKQTHKPGIFQ